MRWIHFALALFLPSLAFSDDHLPPPANDPLVHFHREHPRLLLTDEQLAADVAAAATDPFRAQLHARIVARAEELLSAPPIVHRLIGPRLLDQSRAAIEHIVTCAMAYRLTGDTRFADRAKRDMLTVSAFADWNPSHFLDVAEMSFAVGIGYDWLYRQLTPDERLTIKQALLDKSLVFAAQAYGPDPEKDHRLFWVRAEMNWNQVCNGGLLTAALAIGEDQPALARLVVNGACASLPRVMARYQPDGGYPEGPGYWSYGTTYNVIILAELEGVLGTDFGLGAAPDFDRTALYRFAVQGPIGLGFNYADGSPNLEPTPAYAWLAERYHHPTALAESRALLAAEIDRKKIRDRFFALNAIWYPNPAVRSSAGLAEKVPLDVHFHGAADIAILRSAWDGPLAIFVGFKAGDNTANHSHLDLGTFVLDADGVRWAEYLGADNYNLPEYFGKKRWTYFRLNNHSQNTITPGNLLQNPKAVAPIVAFSDAPDRAFAVADLTAAYPGTAKQILRGVALLDRTRVLVQDDFSGLRSGIPLHWGMVTEAKIALSVDGRTATLTLHDCTLRAVILEPKSAVFQVTSTRPPTPEENQNKGTAMLTIETAPAVGDVRLAVLLTPSDPSWPQLPPPVLTPLRDWRDSGRASREHDQN
jgi:hypothetical protein